MTPAERSLVRLAIDNARAEGYAAAFADEARVRFRVALSEARALRDAGRPWRTVLEIAKCWRQREQLARGRAEQRRAEVQRLIGGGRDEDIVLVLPVPAANEDEAAPAAE